MPLRSSRTVQTSRPLLDHGSRRSRRPSGGHCRRRLRFFLRRRRISCWTRWRHPSGAAGSYCRFVGAVLLGVFGRPAPSSAPAAPSHLAGKSSSHSLDPVPSLSFPPPTPSPTHYFRPSCLDVMNRMPLLVAARSSFSSLSARFIFKFIEFYDGEGHGCLQTTTFGSLKGVEGRDASLPSIPFGKQSPGTRVSSVLDWRVSPRLPSYVLLMQGRHRATLYS